MAAPVAAEVLSLVGFLTGAALYAILLALVLRSVPRDQRDPLPLATAVLGLIWNLGELASYAAPRVGLPRAAMVLTAAAFPALGLLAAVVVHSVARGLAHGRLITLAAYASSTVATALHLSTLVTGDATASSVAFTVLTISYGLTIVPLAVMTRAQQRGPRALWMLALAGFAVSANHLGRLHGTGADGWFVEVLGHHAAMPLAFAILYQDYRFAFADLFLKQALSLLAVVALVVGGYAVVRQVPGDGPGGVGLLLAVWVATVLVYPALRSALARFVDAVLLGRGDYRQLRAEITQALQEQPGESQVLQHAATRLAAALSATRVWWRDASRPAGEDSLDGERATAQVDVPTAEAPSYVLHVGTLTGGRRLLSDDLALLEAVATTAGRRIDAVRLLQERHDQQLREEEMVRLAAEAELRALRAQINPHFLFNALTTIGYLIESAPARAVQTLVRLTALLRGVLRSEGEFTTLGRELDLVQHYLDIERERFEERLRVHIDVPDALRTLRVPCLVVQPLVENAVKHGVAPAVQGGDVVIDARIDAARAEAVLRLEVRNTGAPLGSGRSSPGTHVGLMNVERRLAGHYGTGASVRLESRDGWTVAALQLPATHGRADVVADEDVRQRA